MQKLVSILIFITLWSAVLITASPASEYVLTWEEETPLITNRDGFAGGVINGKIYAFGGNGDPGARNLKSTEMFTPGTGSWVYKADNEHNNGRGVEELTATVVNGKLYVFGAWGGGSPYGVFNFVEEYDPATDTWTSKAPMPTTRAAATAVCYNGEIYLFGGYYSNILGEKVRYDVVEAYNPVTDTWRFVTNMPKVIELPAIAIVGHRVYVTGGYSYDEDRMLNDVMVYDFQTGEWITTGFTPLPTPRAFPCSSAAPVVNGKIYLIGGIMGTSASHWTTDEVEIYDTATNTWSTGPPIPQSTACHLAVFLNDTIYVIGGVTAFGSTDSEDDERTGAVWKLKLPISTIFSDLAEDHWANSYIEAIYSHGITTGYGDGTYGPEDPVSRDQMAAFIIRALYGETFSYNSTPYFIDVPSSHWAFKYIQKLKELGITTGCGSGQYCPEEIVTREQMAAFLIRARAGEDFSCSSEPYFSDVTSDHWAFDYIQKLRELEITTGYGDGTYGPDDSVTRDQMAAFLYRAFLQ
jgi:N-acetylneuraminic acid mutarotase